MAGPGQSTVVALLLAALLFSGMQLGAATFRSSKAATIAGGFCSSLLFVLLLTVRA